jgi:phage protein D
MQPLETVLALYFADSGEDVWKLISKDLLSFSFSDSETNTADSVSMTLKDESGKWAGKWSPYTGEKVKASIKSMNGKKVKGVLHCGKFFIDTMRVSGAPRTFEMSGVSIPLNKAIRKKVKTKILEKTTLKEIAQDIAKSADVKLLFDSQSNPSYTKIEQNKESDLKFLMRLCEEAGLSLKVTDERLIVFDQNFYESKEPIKTFSRDGGSVLSYSFELNQSEIYKSVTVAYRNPKKKKRGKAGGYTKSSSSQKGKKKDTNPAVVYYTETDPSADENGQEYQKKTALENLEAAKRWAKAKLRQLNRRGVTGNLSVIGDVDLVAGSVIRVRGFGNFDGNFIIEKADHSLDSSGYVTSVSLRRVRKEF